MFIRTIKVRQGEVLNDGTIVYEDSTGEQYFKTGDKIYNSPVGTPGRFGITVDLEVISDDDFINGPKATIA